MEPIINPWVFYYIEVLDRLSTAIAVVMFACVAEVFVSGMSYYGYKVDEPTKRRCIKNIKAAGVIFLVFGTVQIVIPDKKTMYQMLAASYVNENNIEAVQNNVVEFVGKIADRLAKAKK